MMDPRSFAASPAVWRGTELFERPDWSITLTDSEPPTAWNKANAREYGFYSNVNPEVDHPRWSQASERRIGSFFRIRTQMFNGYADQVANLYEGMDLRRNY